VGPTAAALLVGDASLGLAERIWALLSDPAGDVERVLDEMAHSGLAGLPSFVLVDCSGEAVRVLVRGSAVTRIGSTNGSGPREVNGLGFRSWREEVLTDVAEMLLADTGGTVQGGPELPVRGGIIRASELRLRLGDPVALPPVVGAPHVPEFSSEPAGDRMPDPSLTLDPSAYDPDGESSAVTPREPVTAQQVDGISSSPAEVAHPPAPPAADPRPGEEYLELLAGMTRLGTVEDAAVRAPRGETASPAASQPVEPAVVAPAPPAPAPTPARSPQPASGLITSVPFASARPSAPGPASRTRPAERRARPVESPSRPFPVDPVPMDQAAQEEDAELTVVRASRGAGAGTGGGAAQSGTGRLPAVVCSRAHANPPESERCRVCAEDLSMAERRWVERPVIGHLRFDGPPGHVPVTGPMVIGRAPRVDGVSGDAVPTMVTVPSADGDVSRSHLRIAVEGWHVMVIDLDATNGTVVQEPNGESRRLHPGEETMIVPGSRVVLADLVGFVFEAQA
jgi:hypothetical protein